MPFVPDNNAPKLKKEEMRSLLVKRANESAVRAQQAAQEAKQNATLLGTLNRGAKKAEKVGDFLGISKFGKGIGTAAYLYGTKDGRELRKKAATGDAGASAGFSAVMDSAPSNKEIIGSAALTGMNMLGGGVLKGGKAVSGGMKIAQGAAQGTGYGIAGGMEQNKDATGIAKQALSGAAVGAGLSAIGVGANKLKENVSSGSQKAAERIYNSAVKPALQDTEKAIKTGGKTLGRELLDRNIKGGSRKLYEVAQKELDRNEEKLQAVLRANRDTFINKSELADSIAEFIQSKKDTPTLKSARDLEKVQRAIALFPTDMSVEKANLIKRNIYRELSGKAFKIDGSLSSEAEINESIALGLKNLIEKKIGGDSVRLLNKELGIFRRLQDSVRKNMARSASNNIAGVGTIGAILEKTVASVPVKTQTATFLDNLGKGISKIKADTAGKISKTAILNFLNSVQK